MSVWDDTVKSLSKSCLLYYAAADHYGCQLEDLVQEIYGFRLCFGKRSYYFRLSDTAFNLSSSTVLARYRHHVSTLLNEAGLSVPAYLAYSSSGKALVREAPQQLGFPLAAKMAEESMLGVNVLCNIQTIEELEQHHERCFQYGFTERMVVEPYYPHLRSYSALIFFGRVMGVLERSSAQVVGDGRSTIRQLIEQQNAHRLQQQTHMTAMPIDIDDLELNKRLAEQGLAIDDTPKNQQTVTLTYTASLGRGGSVKPVFINSVPASNKKIMVKALTVLGLAFASVDVLCHDVTKPFKKQQYYIINVCDRPDITAFEAMTTPYFSRQVIQKIIHRHPWQCFKNWLSRVAFR